MGGLFKSGANTQAAQPPAPVAAFNVQTSTLGKGFTVIYGTTRVPGNLLWYGDFYSVQTQSASSGAGGAGGKGGLFGGGNASTATQITYTYFVSVEIGICEGPIVGFGQVFVDKAIYASPAALGFTTFTGTYPQTPWTYLTTNHKVINEVHAIPGTPFTLSVNYTQQPFTDHGVVSAAGTVFAAVGSAPAAGQYAVSAFGVYTFNSADAGTSVTISYEALNQQPPNEAIGYNGLAYVAANLSLGTNAALPNYNFEIQGVYSNSVSGSQDADPSLVVADLLTNNKYGAGFPSAMIGDLTNFQNYCLAAGLLISVAYSDQAAVSQLLDDIGLATNSAPVWNGTKFVYIPYGDTAITGNGKTYTPPSQPAFALADDDFMVNQGSSQSASSSGDDPVLVDRKRPADKVNSVKVEFLNRSNSYNVEIIEAKEQALIDTFGLRQSSSIQAHMFANANAASMAAQLNLLRQLVSNVFTFTVDARYAAIDPMDIVTLTDATLGLNAQWVRVTEITENDDDSFTIVAEEYLQGTGVAPLYSFQQNAGFSGNTNEAPGGINQPIVFEPTDELGQTMGLNGGLIIAAAVSGVNPATWGGCQIWASYEPDSDYQQVATLLGPSRMGVLTAPLAAVTASATGQTVDNTNTLSIDLTQSQGTLSSGTISDATSLNTRCFVGLPMGTAQGEIVAYQTATLGTKQFTYGLTTLVRGGYGTEANIATWPVGTSFVRLDQGVAAFPYDQSRIGSTLYLKFLSFNIYGGGMQTLAAVLPFAYVIQGYALASPLPDVQNFRSNYVAATTNLSWDEIEDFRPVLYEIRQGAAWAGALTIGRVAHPPFATFGDGTYWIAAISQPVSGLTVYSEDPQSIIITGSVITTFILETWDEMATGWLGTFGGGAGSEGPIGFPGFFIRSGGSGNILTVADFLAMTDVLNYGGNQSGTYEIPSAHFIDVGYVGPNQVMITWIGTGSPVNNNFLLLTDMLNTPDILGAASTAFVDVYPEIAVSQDAITYSAYQKFSPGVYPGRAYKARMQLQTIDPATNAICEAFTFGINVPARIDHYTNVALGSGGSTITFQPDLAAAPAAFNGGPNGATVPHMQVTILGAQAGDLLVTSASSLSSVTLQVTNGGLGVARNVNALVEGF